MLNHRASSTVEFAQPYCFKHESSFFFKLLHESQTVGFFFKSLVIYSLIKKKSPSTCLWLQCCSPFQSFKNRLLFGCGTKAPFFKLADEAKHITVSRFTFPPFTTYIVTLNSLRTFSWLALWMKRLIYSQMHWQEKEKNCTWGKPQRVISCVFRVRVSGESALNRTSENGEDGTHHFLRLT